jgi:uncharacterized protein VirK/YbjX
MFEAASPFERPINAFVPLIRSLKFGELNHLKPGSILDRGIRFSNALLDLPSAVSWVRFLAELERQRKLPSAPPDTVVKPLRNFAVHRLSVRQRCGLLHAHYAITARALPPWAFAALWTGSRIPLGTLSGRKGGKYHLILEPSGHCGREGEYTFTLIAEDGFELAKLTFTLADGFGGSNETQLLIGGLQGASSFFGAGGKERVISATRDLSGLRPKMAVFVAASVFARLVGASSLLAVSNRTHTINADAWYQRSRLVADYDAFWIERGGSPSEVGFQIPLNLEPRSSCAGRNQQRRHVADFVGSFFHAHS